MSATPPTYAEFIVLFPALDDLTQAVIESALSLSTRILNEDAWGDFYGDAIGLDAAHNLAIDAMIGDSATGGFKGAVGPINSVSGAGLTTTFSTKVSSGGEIDAWYQKTAYGQKFLQLQKRVIPMGVLAV